ncbi:MAG: hypothetical protein DMF87_18910 [Acidobacteria bacterium]|nr:MAG: hypothetical protein DMF87_18910 [Acidobacteriota bacterium]
MNSTRILHGVYGGLAGGLIFGVMMGMMGMLPMIARMAGSSSPAIGFGIHLIISAVIGAIFAIIVADRLRSVGSAVGAGLVYGVAWWLLGPLTLMPLMMGMSVTWTGAAMSAGMPSLVGHLVYGAILGGVYGWLERPVPVPGRA